MHKAIRLVSFKTFSRRMFLFPAIAGFILSSIIPANKGMAQGNLLIMPGRVVFEGTKKSQELTLANTGADTSRYIISFVQMRMKEDGSFDMITTPDSGQQFANKYLRVFPRSVTLPPNQSQVIKVQLNKPAKMEAGEYRSHLYFRASRREAALGEEPADRDSGSMAVKLTPVFGITIPAIIRNGDCSVKVNLINPSLEMVGDTMPRLQITFTRTGNISTYGDITVNHISAEGKITKVGYVKGVAVYTPNPLRRFQYNLNPTQGVDYHTGKLQILYTAPDNVKVSKIAETELILH
jgi:hypothetical protein